MEITKNTYCGKKDASQPSGYSRVTVYSNEIANDLQLGHHGATLEQLNAKGWIVYVDTVYDSATEKLALVWSDDGSIISKAKIDLTPEEILTAKVKSMTDAIQAHLDTTAQAWGYDNIISLCTYDGNSDPKYSAEGAAGKEWRSSVWRYCEDELAKIEAGTRQEPESDEAFIAELPTITRPKV